MESFAEKPPKASSRVSLQGPDWPDLKATRSHLPARTITSPHRLRAYTHALTLLVEQEPGKAGLELGSRMLGKENRAVGHLGKGRSLEPRP